MHKHAAFLCVMAALLGLILPGRVWAWSYETGNIVQAAPAVGADGTIYVGSTDGKLYALNPDGSLKWAFPSSTPVGAINFAPTIGADGTIYFGANDATLYAVNSNGTLAWSAPLGAAAFSGIGIGPDGTLYVANADRELQAFTSAGATKTGWSTHYVLGPGYASASPAIATDGTIYIGVTESTHTRLRAINPDKTLKWQTDLLVGSAGATPAIGSDGTVYFNTKLGGAQLYAINPSTGAHTLLLNAAGAIETAPVIDASGNIVVADLGGIISVVSPSGTLVRTHSITLDQFTTSPAVTSNGWIVAATNNGNLWAFKPGETDVSFTVSTGHNIIGSPAIASDGTVYVTSNDKKLHALATSFGGPAATAWPMYGQNNRRTRLATSEHLSVSTGAVSGLTSTGATVSGSVAVDAGYTVTDKGICLGTTASPTACTSAGTGGGAFSVTYSTLLPGTAYYARAYATSSAGLTRYGADLAFSTLNTFAPEVETVAVSDITGNSAAVKGKVVDDKGYPVTQRGICLGNSPSPTNCAAAESGGLGEFSLTFTELTPNATYYARAFATNSQGTSYGADLSFVSTANLPVVTTGAVSELSTTGATVAGSVTADGGYPVTQRGICLGAAAAPTTCTPEGGTGLGAFSVSFTQLTPYATYYARAYATNSQGTAYGADVSFIAQDSSAPKVSTGGVSAVNSNRAHAEGTVTLENGSSVTERGICVGLSEASAQCIASGSGGLGTFSQVLSDLEPESTYYYFAYATNATATGKGEVRSFTTLAGPRSNENWAMYWRSPQSGDNVVLYFTGTTQSRAKYTQNVSPGDWTAAGYADFDKDGSPDALFRNTQSGQCSIDRLQGYQHLEYIALQQVSLQYEVAAVGDVNGDGYKDIVWQNTETSELAAQLLEGTVHKGVLSMFTVGTDVWQIATAGDFDGDGTDDLVFLNPTSGQNAIVLLQNGGIKPNGIVVQSNDLPVYGDSPKVSPYDIVGAADVDGDGQTDRIWVFKDGNRIFAELMNGTSRRELVLVGTAPQGWTAHGAANVK